MKLKIYLLAGFMVGLTACSKNLELKVDNIDFNATVESANVKVGDEVVFNFLGTPEIISFYSGENYNDYNFKDGHKESVEDLKMSFSTSITTGTQANQLAVMASTDFNGNYENFSSVQAATWTDITSRFVLATNATVKASGAKDISDLAVAGRPLYIAFKYTTKPQVTSGEARTWVVQNLSVTGTTAIGSVSMYTNPNAGFRIVDQNPATAPARSRVLDAQVTLLGNTFNATNDPESENWAVSRALNIDEIDLGADNSKPLKGFADPQLPGHKYTYTKPGTYVATFVAANTSIDGKKEVVKQFNIVVAP